jgi:putative ATP-dependent endonuclease of OLD family
MNTTNQSKHPLEGFSINICGVKCFDDAGSGFFRFAPITVIIGKNNSGKSTILDVLQEGSKKQGRMFEGAMSRAGAAPRIEIESHPDRERLKINFSSNTRSAEIPGASHWAYANERILPHMFIWQFDQNRTATQISDNRVLEDLVARARQGIINSLDFPFSGLWSMRIRAERDVQPEQRDTKRELSPSGRGLTNLVRAFINSEDLPRKLVEIDLLRDINKIYLGDSHFTAITCQENEASGDWEIYLREDGKGDIRLSQSGSSLKTVFLVLAFLRLIPEVKRTGASTKMLFCLEEPENNLHPALLRRLIDFLAQQRRELGFGLIITTHSPICIDFATKRDDCTILHVRVEDDRTKCQNVLDYEGQSNILNDLDVRGSDILQSNGIIWVEGPSDRIYIRKWIDLVSEGTLREGVHFSFMFYGGKILNHFDALPPEELPAKIAMLAVNRNIAVIIDSDRRPTEWHTKTGRKRRPQMRLNATKKEILRQVEKHGGFSWVTAGKEIENYVPSKIWDLLASKSLNINGEYDDIPSRSELRKIAPTKVDLAHKVEAMIGLDEIVGNLDLEKCIHDLCRHIRAWNGLN